jgi:hypothetical protein
MRPSRNGIELLGLSSSSFRSRSLVRWVISALVAFAIGIVALAPDPAAAASRAKDFVWHPNPGESSIQPSYAYQVR